MPENIDPYTAAELIRPSLTLKTDPEDFGNPETDRFDIASPYDQKDFYLMPLRSNAVWLSRIELETAGAPEQFTVDTSQRRLIATPFNALVSGTSVYPRWLYVAANATTNTAAMLTSIVSINSSAVSEEFGRFEHERAEQLPYRRSNNRSLRHYRPRARGLRRSLKGKVGTDVCELFTFPQPLSTGS